MCILRPDLEEDALSTNVGKIQETITAAEGDVLKVDKWSKRPLAYEIKDFKEGLYVIFRVKGEKRLLKDLSYTLKYHPDVLRYSVLAY
jgi:small subunit ribosomal protein S6